MVQLADAGYQCRGQHECTRIIYIATLWHISRILSCSIPYMFAGLSQTRNILLNLLHRGPSLELQQLQGLTSILKLYRGPVACVNADIRTRSRRTKFIFELAKLVYRTDASQSYLQLLTYINTVAVRRQYLVRKCRIRKFFLQVFKPSNAGSP